MTIGVKLFAIVREAAGASALTMELPDGATVADAREELLRRLPAAAPHLRGCAFAVNRNYSTESARLSDGDEVAVIPPVSGG